MLLEIANPIILHKVNDESEQLKRAETDMDEMLASLRKLQDERRSDLRSSQLTRRGRRIIMEAIESDEDFIYDLEAVRASNAAKLTKLQKCAKFTARTLAPRRRQPVYA